MSTSINITTGPGKAAEPAAVAPDIDTSTRALIHHIADALMPDTGLLPSVTDADTAGHYLDLALIARPDLVDLFLDAVGRVSPATGDGSLERLRDENGKHWEVLTTILPAAYLMNPAVRQALGYQGQTAEPIQSSDPEELSLTEAVTARGPIYRPTPAEPEA